MFEGRNAVIYDITASSEALSVESLEELLQRSNETGMSLADLLVDGEFVERHELLRMVAAFLNLELILTPPSSIDPKVTSELDPRVAQSYGVVPIASRGDSLTLLARDPFNSRIVDDLSLSLNREIRLQVCDPDRVNGLIGEVYGGEHLTVEDFLREYEAGSTDHREGEPTVDELFSLSNDAPIVRFVDLVLSQAVDDQASDIHFEPFEDHLKIRYRVDGALYEMAPAPIHLTLPVISRIKVLSNLNIAERRVPQDGRIRMEINRRPVDLRVATLPTQNGESVVLRVLDRTVVNLDLEKLAMPPEVLRQVRRISSRPNGIFIVTGPTGSGKTTTLYSALSEVNRPELKILTAEDPVEYEIDGIMQLAVNSGIGLTFASAIRSFLRQDPDKIMVGEIRDLETARIAVQAALTGHLVMSTLHTNDAPGAVTRLLDMGVEPFLAASTLECIVAQRLVRRICRECREEFRPNPKLLEQLVGGIPLDETVRCFRGRGCAACNETGYKGRLGIFEMLQITGPVRELIAAQAPASRLRRIAIKGGMKTLRQEAIRLVRSGESTIEEVCKCT